MDLRCWCETFAIMLMSPRKEERVMSLEMMKESMAMMVDVVDE